jgi:hypothetical protein
MKAFLKTSLCLLVAASFSGCALFPEPAAKPGAVPAKKVLIIKEDPPAVSDLNTGRASFDKLMQVGGEKGTDTLVLIPSTISLVEDTVFKSWASGRKARLREERVDFDGAKPADLKAWAKDNKPDADYIVDTSIRKWGVKNHPKDITRKLVYVSLNHKIIDAHSGKVLVNRSCTKDTSDTALEKSPTTYTLLKDNRALLRSVMKDLTLACLPELEGQKKKKEGS